MAFGGYGNPMDFFQVGKGLGAANGPSPAGPQSVMDMFNTQMENQMKYGLQTGLQQNEQELLNKYEPARKGAEVQQELQAKGAYMKNMFQNLGLNGGGGGDASTSTDASKPAQAGIGKQKNNMMLQSIDPMTGDMKFGNTNYDAAQAQAKTGPAVDQANLETLSKAAIQAEQVRHKLDRMKSFYDNSFGGGGPVSVEKLDPISAASARAAQNAMLEGGALTGKNYNWKNYKDESEALNTSIARGEFQDLGRVAGAQLQQAMKSYTNGWSSEEEANGKWSTMYGILDDIKNQYQIASNSVLGGNATNSVGYSGTSNKVSREDALVTLRKRGHKV